MASTQQQSTVGPPIMDTPTKGYTRINPSIKDTLCEVPSLLHFNLGREDNLSIKDKMAGPMVHYLEVPQHTVRHTEEEHFNMFTKLCICLSVLTILSRASGAVGMLSQMCEFFSGDDGEGSRET